jgi:hypothetical protein
MIMSYKIDLKRKNLNFNETFSIRELMFKYL